MNPIARLFLAATLCLSLLALAGCVLQCRVDVAGLPAEPERGGSCTFCLYWYARVPCGCRNQPGSA